MNSSIWKCVQYIMNATRQVHEKGVLEGAWVNNELVGGFWKFQWCQQLGWCVRLWERRPLGDYSNRNQWFLYKHHQCFLFRKSSIQRQKQTSYMGSDNKYYSLHPRRASKKVVKAILKKTTGWACYGPIGCVCVCVCVLSCPPFISRFHSCCLS